MCPASLSGLEQYLFTYLVGPPHPSWRHSGEQKTSGFSCFHLSKAKRLCPFGRAECRLLGRRGSAARGGASMHTAAIPSRTLPVRKSSGMSTRN